MLFFEHKGLYRRIKEDLPAGDYTVPIGKAKVVREGRDLTIITYGAMVWTALEAAESWPRKAFRPKWWICGRWCRSTAKPFAPA